MHVNASINEPFVLSTYATSQLLSKKSKAERKKATLANIFASHVAGRLDGYATVTAQAEGVHILDVRFYGQLWHGI